MSKFTVQFLTRSQCPLCDEARSLVRAEVERLGGRFEEVDVDASEDLREIYGTRVPVVVTENRRVIAEGRIEKRALRKSLRTWR